ncbi:MAG TPA: DUF2203 domain-containing protein [Anaerolineales bacterium]
MAPRLFTVDEAKEAIKLIRPLIGEILRIRADVLSRQPELWTAMQRAAGNGGSADLSRLAKDFDRLDKLVHRILDSGAEIKDLGEGLVDFRASRRDQTVYLCWKYGEEDLAFWHDMEAGFSGRKPLAEF